MTAVLPDFAGTLADPREGIVAGLRGASPNANNRGDLQ